MHYPDEPESVKNLCDVIPNNFIKMPGGCLRSVREVGWNPRLPGGPGDQSHGLMAEMQAGIRQ